MNETDDNEFIVTYMAMDDYSSFLYPPLVVASAKTDNELIETLVKFYNSIIDNYNSSIHAQNITFITHLPQPVNDLLKAIIMPNDNLIADSIRVQKIFEPIFKMMGH